MNEDEAIAEQVGIIEMLKIEISDIEEQIRVFEMKLQDGLNVDFIWRKKAASAITFKRRQISAAISAMRTAKNTRRERKAAESLERLERHEALTRAAQRVKSDRISANIRQAAEEAKAALFAATEMFREIATEAQIQEFYRRMSAAQAAVRARNQPCVAVVQAEAAA